MSRKVALLFCKTSLKELGDFFCVRISFDGEREFERLWFYICNYSDFELRFRIGSQ